MTKNKGALTKRQEIREKRRQKQRNQRLLIIGLIVAGALLIVGALIYPSIKQARTPVGEIITITPEARPMVEGKSIGDPNAPVKVDIYEDFQCPACREFSSSVVPQIVEDYVVTGKVYLTYRQFPFLDDRYVTKESDQAANASMCALEQNRFWDYHDMLFANWNGENQGAFTDKRLVAFAEALKLEMEAFTSCFEDNRYQEEINADLASGRNANITGTPSVLVNGQLISTRFVPSFDDISQAVEAALISQ